jgi:hypothetical protein
MRPPGRIVRAICARLYAETTMARVIDPAIADMQHEHLVALRSGSSWRAGWAVVAGYFGFLKIVGLHTIVAPVDACRGWIVTDDWIIGRTIILSLIAVLGLTVLATMPSWAGAPMSMSRATAWLLLLCLVPQALPLSIPAGLCIGIAGGLSGRVASWRVVRSVLGIAIAGALLVWVALEWLIPDANQMFRTLVLGRPLPRGVNELALSELAARTDPLSVRQFHIRWALCCGTVILAIFALGLSAFTRRRVAGGLLGLATWAVYISPYWNLPRESWISPMADAWIPNLVVGLASLALIRRDRPASHVT